MKKIIIFILLLLASFPLRVFAYEYPEFDKNFISPFALYHNKGLDGFYQVRILDKRNSEKTILSTSEGFNIGGNILNNYPGIFFLNEKKELKVIDLYGYEATDRFPFLKDRKFSMDSFVLFPKEKKLIYSLGNSNEKINDKDKNITLFIKDFNNKLISTISNKELPNGLVSSRPFGWSSDNKNLYVAKIGWEGFDYAGLWKVDINTKKVTKINGLDGVPLYLLSVVPEKDIAVGISAKEKLCDDCMGGAEAGAPFSIKIIDLKKNIYNTIHKTNKDISDIYLSPSADNLFFTEDKILKKMNLKDRRITKIGSGMVTGMSFLGDKIIVENSGKYRIMNTINGASLDILKGKEGKVNFIHCSYPLGFSCYYQK